MDATRQLFIEIAKTHGIDGADFSEPSSQFLTVNGVRFHYLDWGGSGQPIFFVHGGGQSAHTWDLVACQLRARYHCVAMDCRGHGLSDKVDRWLGYAEQGDDIKGVAGALGLRDFALVGMSMGGLASLAYAARNPQTIRALTMVDITPTINIARRQEGPAQMMGAHPFDSFDHALDWAVKNNPGRPRVHMEYSLRHSLEEKPDGKWMWKNERRNRMRAEAPEDREKRMAATELLWQDPPKIPCPALVVHGELSNVTSRADAERLAKLFPNGRVTTVPAATHTVQGDQPKALARELQAFLSEGASLSRSNQ